MTPYKIHKPTGTPIPIVISVPHCGVLFPDDIRQQYNANLIGAADDTDWDVDRLYDFAPAMGITMISAVYSRWVIDLNRDPASKPLYTDGRIITALCPTTDFLGQPLYGDGRTVVEDTEVSRRHTLYYKPYHEQIQLALDDLKSKFRNVLLWDCHSIRQVVPMIQSTKFPDLILGDADETSASANLILSTLETLQSSSFSVGHNNPFKGGTITRSFGKPHENQHALQLEMTKVNYMDNEQKHYDAARAGVMRKLLQRTFLNLAQQLTH